MLAPPDLTTMAFAVRDTGQPLAERNAATRRLIEHINARQRVNLSGTTLNGVFAIRIAIVAFRTHKDRVEMLLVDLMDGLKAEAA